MRFANETMQFLGKNLSLFGMTADLLTHVGDCTRCGVQDVYVSPGRENDTCAVCTVLTAQIYPNEKTISNGKKGTRLAMGDHFIVTENETFVICNRPASVFVADPGKKLTVVSTLGQKTGPEAAALKLLTKIELTDRHMFIKFEKTAPIDRLVLSHDRDLVRISGAPFEGGRAHFSEFDLIAVRDFLAAIPPSVSYAEMSAAIEYAGKSALKDRERAKLADVTDRLGGLPIPPANDFRAVFLSKIQKAL